MTRAAYYAGFLSTELAIDFAGRPRYAIDAFRAANARARLQAQCAALRALRAQQRGRPAIVAGAPRVAARLVITLVAVTIGPTTVGADDGPIAEVKIHADVLDRDTGAPKRVCYVTPTRSLSAVRRVREALQAFVLHEVDEAIRLDGDLYFDPHRKG